jgi:hypothetical protein
MLAFPNGSALIRPILCQGTDFPPASLLKLYTSYHERHGEHCATNDTVQVVTYPWNRLLLSYDLKKRQAPDPLTGSGHVHCPPYPTTTQRRERGGGAGWTLGAHEIYTVTEGSITMHRRSCRLTTRAKKDTFTL